MTDRERDAAMERLLRRTLAAEDEVPGSDCLDVETLAAWSDDALTVAERSSAEAHAAGCARCQAALAAMVRTTAPTADSGTGARSLIHRWAAWLVPAMAAATAIALWIAVDRTSVVQTPVVQAPAAPAPAPTGSVAREIPPTAGPAEMPTRSIELEKQAADKEQRVNRSTRAERGREGALAGAAADRLPTTLADARQNERKDEERERLGARAANAAAAKAAERDAQTRPATPPPPPVSPSAEAPPPRVQAEPQATPPVQTTPPVQQAPPPAPQQQTGQVAETVALRSRQSTAAAGRADSADQVARRAEGMQFATATLDITIPGSSIRWRVVGSNELLRSADGGTTWQKQAIEIAAPITAGAAPSPTVCWLVGRSGIVLLTTDGATWRRVAFPEAVDLSTIAASDARNARVTAVDRRTFVTTDGGQTWTRR